MWKKILKYRDTAHDLHKMEVRSGESTSFWYDIWCPIRNLFKVLGSRGTIDLGIVNHATVAEVMNLHRRKRHRVDLLNQIENDIDIVRHARKGEPDRSLWKQKHDDFKGKFSSQHTWQQIRVTNPRCDWSA